MSATHGHALSAVVALFLAIHAPLILAGDPPDLASNPVTGWVESVDIATDSGDRVRHAEDGPTALGGSDQLISTDAGISPRIACRADGQTWIVWWRDADPDQVHFRYRDASTSAWSDEGLVSESNEPGRHPELVIDGTTTWVAFETDDGLDTGVSVRAVTDSPEPFDTQVTIATTDFDGDVAVMIHAELGHLWVTWVDSPDDVGWSEYDHTGDIWALPQYEPYEGHFKVALEAIQAIVHGN